MPPVTTCRTYIMTVNDLITQDIHHTPCLWCLHHKTYQGKWSMVIIHANVAAVEVQHFSILMKPNLKRTPESCVQPEGKANLYLLFTRTLTAGSFVSLGTTKCQFINSTAVSCKLASTETSPRPRFLSVSSLQFPFPLVNVCIWSKAKFIKPWTASVPGELMSIQAN